MCGIPPQVSREASNSKGDLGFGLKDILCYFIFECYSLINHSLIDQNQEYKGASGHPRLKIFCPLHLDHFLIFPPAYTSDMSARALSSCQNWQPNRRQALMAAPTLLSLAQARGTTAAPVIASSVAPAIPTYEVAPDLSISRIIKGCWQLSGGHRGDRDSDRTTGGAAVDDFQQFVDAGITTLDTADIYGPSEKLIGQFLAGHPDARKKTQVLTKFCCFGDSMRQARRAEFVKQVSGKEPHCKGLLTKRRSHLATNIHTRVAPQKMEFLCPCAEH